MTDLDELLVRELGLQGLDEPRRGLTGGVRDDVELDGRIRHRIRLTGAAIGPTRASVSRDEVARVELDLEAGAGPR